MACERVRESAAVVRKSKLMETDWGKGKGHRKRKPQKTPLASKWLNIPPPSGGSKSNAPHRHLQQKSISIFRTRDLIKTRLFFWSPWMFLEEKRSLEKSLKGRTDLMDIMLKWFSFTLCPFLMGRVGLCGYREIITAMFHLVDSVTGLYIGFSARLDRSRESDSAAACCSKISFSSV